MKKILLYLLLLCSISTFAQAEFPEGIQVTNVQDNTALKVNVQNATGVINWKYLTDFQKEKAILSTGLIKNGLISANGDPTKFNITAGIGIISNFDDPENPTSTLVNFTAFTGITPTYLLTGTITYVAINDVAAVVMQATPFTPEQRRSLIVLGAVIHSNLTTINVINNISAPTNASTNQLHDFIEAVGALNLTGNKYTANGANLQLNKSAGLIFKLGSNFANDWKNPHELSQTAGTSLTFRYRTQNGTEGSDRINLDPALYDLNNVLTSVPNNKFTIQTVTMFQSGVTRIQYGQNVYDDLATAKNAVFTRNFVLEPNSKENGIIRAYIIMKNTTTSLQNVADADILEAQKFGGVASGGVALTLANIVSALGFTPENVDNKVTTLTNSNTDYPTSKAVLDALPTTYTKIVYVNTTSPTTATIFDLNNPPVTNDNALKNDVNNLYIGTDSSTWVYNGSTYTTKVVPATSNFYVNGTPVDAGNNKDLPINRIAPISVLELGVTGASMWKNTLSLFKYVSGVSKYVNIYWDNITNNYNAQMPNKPAGTETFAMMSDVANSQPLIPHLEYDNSDMTIWNNGKGDNSTNTSFGQNAGTSNTTGTGWQAYGLQAGASNTSGSFWVANGLQAGLSNTTSSFWIANGFLAGAYASDKTTLATSIEKSIFIGYRTSPLMNSQTNQIVIGNDANGLGSNSTVIGNTDTVKARMFGRFLSGTDIDNGVDQVQVNGSISATNYTGGATLTGNPTAPTPTLGDNDTSVATTAFVNTAVLANASKWTQTGNDIVNNNTGNIGIGSPISSYKVTVSGTGFDAAGNIFTNYIYPAVMEGGRFLNLTGISNSNALIKYTTDISSTYDDRTLVDKGFNDKNRMKSFTVATLPASPTQGDSYAVTDALAPTYLVTVVGGGTVYAPVVWNGTNWVSH